MNEETAAPAPPSEPPAAKKAPSKQATVKARRKAAAKDRAAAAEKPDANTRKKRQKGLTLVVSEKNIAAEKIAKILSEGKLKIFKIKGIPVYEFEREGKPWAVVGLKGHIVAMDYPRKYNRWFKVDPRELVTVAPERRVEEKEIAAALSTLAKEAHKVVVATDFDREGELIGVEALGLVREANPGVEAVRSRFSSITTEEIGRAFGNLAAIDDNLAASAEARQVIDLAWGASLTRFISLASGQVGQDFLSIGRVQSPTLALVVDKEKEIRAFVPTPYWEIAATLEKETSFPASHKQGRFDDEASATAALARAKAAAEAVVTEAHRTERREKPPEPFHTTAFLAAATRLGLSAARAMNVAENLYMNGWVSYPRTDNTQYPPELDLRDILKKLATQEQVGHLAERILEKPELSPTKGKKKTTDHPPIHPTGAPRKSDLDADGWKVWELVARRFLATLSDEARIENIRVALDVGGEPFEARGQRMLEPGWKGVYPYVSSKEALLPPLAGGDRARVVQVDVERKTTQPPKRFSQGRLLEEMEALGLGTKSTRHEILNKLYARGYVRNSPPEPNETAFAVTDALENYASHIARPEMTAALEKEMDEIAEGRKRLDEVVDDSRRMLLEILDVLESNRDKIAVTVRKAIDAQNTVGRCPKDGGPLMIRKGRAGKRFVGCGNYPNCEQTYPLPQYGKIVSEQQHCATCQSPVIKIVNKGRRPWVLCINMQCPDRGTGEVRIAGELAGGPSQTAGAGGDGGAGEESSRPPDESVEELDHSADPTGVEEKEIE